MLEGDDHRLADVPVVADRLMINLHKITFAITQPQYPSLRLYSDDGQRLRGHTLRLRRCPHPLDLADGVLVVSGVDRAVIIL